MFTPGSLSLMQLHNADEKVIPAIGVVFKDMRVEMGVNMK